MTEKTTESVKREAKALARETGNPHSQELDRLARRAGFSHWGAYQVRLRAGDVAMDLDDERLGRFVNLADLVKKVAPDAIIEDPDLLKARHMIVCGATAAGKTVFLQKLLDAAPKRSPIVVLDMMNELKNPNPLWEVPASATKREKFGRTVTREVYEAYGSDAYRMPWQYSFNHAGIVAIDSILKENISAVLHAMKYGEDGPSILTTMHGYDPENLRDNLSYMRRQYGGSYPEGPVMCVQMMRNEIGKRVVGEIFAF